MAATVLAPPARFTRSPRSLPDEVLAARVADGDDQAFAALYDRHHQALHRYALSLLRHPEDAQDALHSAMVKALASLQARTPVGAVRAWLFRAVHNEAVTVVRRRRPAEELTEALAGAADGDREVAERVRAVLEDLRHLPDQQRASLVLRELNGLEYEEIAAVLGTSTGNARQAVFKARTALVDLERGRDLGCDAVRTAISDGDGRALRARALRSHLRACPACTMLQASIRRRTAALGLVPVLPGAAAAALLESVVGTASASGAGAAAAGAAAGAAGAAAGGGAAAGAAGAAAGTAAVGAGGAGAATLAAGTAAGTTFAVGTLTKALVVAAIAVGGGGAAVVAADRPAAQTRSAAGAAEGEPRAAEPAPATQGSSASGGPAPLATVDRPARRADDAARGTTTSRTPQRPAGGGRADRASRARAIRRDGTAAAAEPGRGSTRAAAPARTDAARRPPARRGAGAPARSRPAPAPTTGQVAAPAPARAPAPAPATTAAEAPAPAMPPAAAPAPATTAPAAPATPATDAVSDPRGSR